MKKTTVQLIFENWQKLEIDDFYEWMFENEEALLREEKDNIIEAWNNANVSVYKESAQRYFLENFKID